MAGIMTVGDEGTEVKTQQVPTIGESMGVPATATVVASIHLGDANRAEGVAYPEEFGKGPTGTGYPAGSKMVDHTPTDAVN